jgi:hypothetical protein
MIAAVALLRKRTIPFAAAVDLYFTGNGPGLLWLIALAAEWALIPTATAYEWMRYQWAWYSFGIFVLIWSAYIDYRFLRLILDRTRGQAVRDLLMIRAVTWIPGLALFLGASAYQVLLSGLGW